jgi:hypothetical protein
MGIWSLPPTILGGIVVATIAGGVTPLMGNSSTGVTTRILGFWFRPPIVLWVTKGFTGILIPKL